MISFENISYKYPFSGKFAVKNINFKVKPGEVYLITGESGCGKSTLAKIANGLIPHYLNGTLTGKVSNLGIYNSAVSLTDISNRAGTLFQDPEQQFFCTDVYSEMAFAHEVKQKSVKDIQDTVAAYADKFELTDILDSSVFTLSEGEKQKVALASVLSLEPKCLILDEPTANLSPEATEMLARQIEQLKKDGFAVMIVDHRLYWLEGIADKVLIMKDGEIKHAVSHEDITKNNFNEKYGLRLTRLDFARKYDKNTAKEGLKVTGLNFAYGKKPAIFENFGMIFPKGKISSLSGANGAGKTTLSRLITGLLKPKSGTFELNGKIYKPKELLKKSGLVLQNMDHQLYAEKVIEEVDGKIELLKKMRLESFATRHPHSLSGGQKQRLVIAAAVAKDPEIIILDEPTSGLDGRNMKIIGQILKEEADRGKIIVVITHDLEFINLYCDFQLRI
ncbi:MAG: ABC transporter [Candidatus Cloacimonadota bacterium]|nr:MAG: ABC transporter [Candidatus Cloacimonadota bacterium]